MTNHADLVHRLRESKPFNHALLEDAAAAITTLLAERAVLGAECEAARAWRDSNAPGGSDRSVALNLAWRETRAATDAAMPGGVK